MGFAVASFSPPYTLGSFGSVGTLRYGDDNPSLGGLLRPHNENILPNSTNWPWKALRLAKGVVFRFWYVCLYV